MSSPAFGTDLGTLMRPSFWGVDSHDDIAALAAREPTTYWNRLLDTAQQAGLQTLELTFPPADFATAEQAFGGLDGFRKALSDRGLTVISSYFGGLESGVDFRMPDGREAILAAAERDAEWVAATGGRFLVIGLPALPSGARSATDIDAETLSVLSSVLNSIGEVSLRHGVRSALHTEAYSYFWRGSDVDLLLARTDPALVWFCPDAGHLALAGDDPAEVLRRHGNRFAMAHWKDTTLVAPADAVDRAQLFEWLAEVFVEPGVGIVEWQSWCDVLAGIGPIDDVVLEIDSAPHPIAALTASRNHIAGLLARSSTS